MISELVRSSATILRGPPRLCAAAARLPGAPAAALQLEELVDPLGQLGGRAVVDGLDPELLPAPPTSISSMMRIMRRMFEPVSVMISRLPGAIDRDVAVLALELAEHVRGLVRVDVARAGGGA